MQTTDDDQAATAAFDLQADSLSGDIRDAMLTVFRQQKRPWSELAEAEQHEVANIFAYQARELVRAVVRVITAHDFPHTAVVLGEVKIKGEKGIEAKIGCPNIEHNRAVLGEHVGSLVTIYMVDSETFMAERAPPDIQPDQPELPLPPDHDPETGEVAGPDGELVDAA